MNNDWPTLQLADAHIEPKYSGLGIASCIISIVVGLFIFVLFVVAGVMEASTPDGIDESSPIAVALGTCILGALVVDLVALGLGIAGLVQQDRNKLFAILGTVFSAATILGTIALLAFGLMIE